MRILLVDDNRDILELVRRVLQTEGHDVIVARDGPEALRQEAATLPDVVVLDVNLPSLDGWEVCKRIKARRNVPIMLLTVRAEPPDIARSRDAGADDHLPKPFDLNELLSRVSNLRARIQPPPLPGQPSPA